VFPIPAINGVMHFFTRILLLLQFALCGYTYSAHAVNTLRDSCAVEPGRYVLFNDTKRQVNFFGDRMTLVQIGAQEVAEVECLVLAFHSQCITETVAFRDSLEQASKGRISSHFAMVDLDNAYRQYQGGKDRKGETLVYVNGMCRTSDDRWKANWVFTHDGGPCYWHAVVNLTTGRIERLSVNGFA
jgi:hypothetical protein